jgi:hypothetical protein
MLLQGISSYHYIAECYIILEKIAGKLVDMLLLDLLKAELASIFKDLLVFADHFPNLHNDRIFSDFFPMLFKVDEEGRLGKVEHIELLFSRPSNFCCFGKLLIDDDTPGKILYHFFVIGDGIHFAEIVQRDINFLLIIVFPNDGLAFPADGDGLGVSLVDSRLSFEVAIEESLLFGLVVALSER